MAGQSQPLLTGIMPAMLKHEGIWEGTYRHIDAENEMIDIHHARVVCEFPSEGPYGYIQRNLFTWGDGREYRSVLNGVLRDGKLCWDTETFDGSAWETDHDLILLNLNRKDEPGANFFEIICMGESGVDRARTWHWFRDGRLYKRTLCDETRIEGP